MIFDSIENQSINSILRNFPVLVFNVYASQMYVFNFSGEGNTDMPNYKRGKEYSIRSITTNSCNLNERAEIQWLLCNISAAVPFPLFEFQANQLFSNTSKRMFHFPTLA